MILLFLSFLLSFCSIGYQFIIAKALGQFSNDEVLSQSVTLGFYLLAMGLGSIFVAKIKIENKYKILFGLEFVLSVVGAFLVPLLYVSYLLMSVFAYDIFVHLNEWTRNTDKVFVFQLMTILIGLLTGAELPLLISIAENSKNKISFNKMMGANYVGCLLGSFVTAMVLLPRLDLMRTAQLMSVINFLAALVVLWHLQNHFKKGLTLVVVLIVFVTSHHWLEKNGDTIQQVYLKSYYLETRMREFSWTSLKNFVLSTQSFKDIERYLTPYQIIDIIPEDFMKNAVPIGESVGDFSLYLNMQPQFSRSTQGSYHESMADAAINLSNTQPHEVLVLGAGDGLLVAQLLKNKFIQKITLVELDPFMIELANSYLDLRKLNKDSLADPRVEVVIGDAFSYIYHTAKKYDGVFVDFPFPVNYEIGKLYSVEFYTGLKKVIKEQGFFVADVPLVRSLEVGRIITLPTPQDIIASTLNKSGIQNFVFYGPFEPFLFAKMDSQKIAFNYEKIPDWVGNKSLVNFNILPQVQKNLHIQEDYINSAFKPQRFRW